MDTNVAVGDRVHRAMWNGRVTQTDLAKRIQMDQSTLSKKLKGERRWYVDELMRVAEALELPASTFLPTAPDLEPGSKTPQEIFGARAGNRPIEDLEMLEIAAMMDLMNAVRDESAPGHEAAQRIFPVMQAREAAYMEMGMWDGGKPGGGLVHPERDEWAATYNRALYERILDARKTRNAKAPRAGGAKGAERVVRLEGLEPPTF